MWFVKKLKELSGKSEPRTDDLNEFKTKKKISIELPFGRKTSLQVELTTIQKEKKNSFMNSSNEGIEPSFMYTSNDDKIVSNRILLKNIVFGTTLGAGKFGKVKIASIKESPGQYFAIKILKKKDVFSIINRVKEEITALTTLKSPFIVRFFGVLEDENRLYILQEYVNGGNLQNFMEQNGKLSESIARYLFIEILLGLTEIHKMQIVFRDLKPENILMMTTGHVKLCDFGLSKKLKKGQLTGTVCGSLRFEAPEILFQSGHDLAADYWSLGIVLYEMLAGKSPFEDMTETQINEAVSANKIPMPEGISREATSVLMLLLEKDRNKRKKNYKAIRTNTWFKDVQWNKFEKQEIKSPLQIEIFEPPKEEKDSPRLYPLTDIETKMFKVLSQECKIVKNEL